MRISGACPATGGLVGVAVAVGGTGVAVGEALCGTGVAVVAALCGAVVGTMAVSVWLMALPALAVGSVAGGVVRSQASIAIIRIRTGDRMVRRFGFMGVSPLEYRVNTVNGFYRLLYVRYYQKIMMLFGFDPDSGIIVGNPLHSFII
jgi:hypothetical protein